MRYKPAQSYPYLLISRPLKIGDFIERGAKLKNRAIGVGVSGAVIAGSFSIAGYYSGTNDLIIAGCVIGGGLGLVAFIMDIVGNDYIRSGGRILHNVQFTGREIKVKF